MKLSREEAKNCHFHEIKEQKNLRDIISNSEEVLRIVRQRIDNIEKCSLTVPKVIQRKNSYPKINGKDIRCYLINQKERCRCLMILHNTKGKISPYFLLYKSIRTNKIRYKGKFLRDFFHSNENYLLAISRIKHGWSIERAIAEQNKKYSFHENGIKGVETLRIKKGFKSRSQTMFYLKIMGLA